jgi:hypothetical protein
MTERCCICLSEDDLISDKHQSINTYTTCTVSFCRNCFKELQSRPKMNHRDNCSVCGGEYTNEIYIKCGIDVYAIERRNLRETSLQCLFNLIKALLCALCIFGGLSEAKHNFMIVIKGFADQRSFMINFLNCLGGIPIALVFITGVMVMYQQTRALERFYGQKASYQYDVLRCKMRHYYVRQFILYLFCATIYSGIFAFHLYLRMLWFAYVWGPTLYNLYQFNFVVFFRPEIVFMHVFLVTAHYFIIKKFGFFQIVFVM